MTIWITKKLKIVDAILVIALITMRRNMTAVVDLEDEEGNIISCPVTDAFEYNDGQYVLVQNPEDGSCYLFKSIGEEGELVIPDDEEFEEVTAYYESLMEEEE